CCRGHAGATAGSIVVVHGGGVNRGACWSTVIHPPSGNSLRYFRGSDWFDPHVEPFAVGHAAAVSVEAHQPAGDVAVGDEQHPFGQLVSSGGFDGDGDFTGVVPHADAVPFGEAQFL